MPRHQIAIAIAVALVLVAGFHSLEDQVRDVSSLGSALLQRSYGAAPEETFRAYSSLIDQGRYDEALELIVLDSGGFYHRPDNHTRAAIKGAMMSTYGRRGERFEILNLSFTSKKALDVELVRARGAEDGYELGYLMRYRLKGEPSTLSEKAVIVGVNGSWMVVYPY